MDQALSEDNESWISLKEELRARLAPEEICMETHFYSLDVFTVGDQNSSATHDSRQPREYWPKAEYGVLTGITGYRDRVVLSAVATIKRPQSNWEGMPGGIAANRSYPITEEAFSVNGDGWVEFSTEDFVLTLTLDLEEGTERPEIEEVSVSGCEDGPYEDYQRGELVIKHFDIERWKEGAAAYDVIDDMTREAVRESTVGRAGRWIEERASMTRRTRGRPNYTSR